MIKTFFFLVGNWRTGIVQQLVLSTGGDDDMGTVLGLLQSAAATNLALKMDILKVRDVCRFIPP
jgi:hypothetical protein